MPIPQQHPTPPVRLEPIPGVPTASGEVLRLADGSRIGVIVTDCGVAVAVEDGATKHRAQCGLLPADIAALVAMLRAAGGVE